MLIPQVSLAHLRAEAPFRSWYVPFTQERLHPLGRESIREQGYDASSLFYRNREKIVDLLRVPGPPSGFDSRDVRLVVVSGRETYEVDVDGRVLTGGKARALPPRAWKELRLTLAVQVPLFDLSEEIGENDDAPKPSPKARGS